MRQQVRRVRFSAPSPLGIEVMTLARLRAITPPDELVAAHRPAFHLLLLVTAGTATHTVDFMEHRLAPGRGLWVRPGQVQRFSADRPSGELVLFQPDFLIPGTHAAALEDDHSAPVAFARSAAPRPGAARASARACRRAGPTRDAAAPAVGRHPAARHPGRPPARGRRRPRALSGAPRARLPIAHDVGPKRIIHGRIALDARRLLAHSDLAISQIGIRLGFRDASNFAAFFAHATGESPSAFRRGQRPAPAVVSARAS